MESNIPGNGRLGWIQVFREYKKLGGGSDPLEAEKYQSIDKMQLRMAQKFAITLEDFKAILKSPD